MKFWVLIFLPLTAFAEMQSNEVVCPHGLGRFYEEPTGYRPSLKGANKMLLTVQGQDAFLSCMAEGELVEGFLSSMAKFPSRPQLGEKGPDDFPQLRLIVSKQSGDQWNLKVEIDLFLPAEISPQKKVQKVSAFAYQYTNLPGHKDCKKSLNEAIDEVVDAWMREYGFYNG